MLLVVFVAAGTLAGLGAVIAWSGFFSRAVPLSVLADDERRNGRKPSTGGGSGIEIFAGDAAVRHAQDLAVLERTPGKFASDRIINAMVFMFLPFVAFVVTLIGYISISPLVLLIVMAAAGIGGWAYTTPALVKSAEEARVEFEASLSNYFELVSLAFAGGKGPDDALREPASIGTGPAFRQLRIAMTASYERREAPWVTLINLGDRLGVRSLVDLGASITMASDGAPVVDSLRAKAETMREHSMAAQEARAESRSETMSFPIVAMFGGFLILFGYPALAGLIALR